jgi:hypothetical protein
MTRMRWEGHCECTEETCNILFKNVKNKHNFENLDVSGRIVLKWIVVQLCGLDE